MRDYIGKFYSLRYVRKNVLKQNEKRNRGNGQPDQTRN